jgi:hypothetical protein
MLSLDRTTEWSSPEAISVIFLPARTADEITATGLKETAFAPPHEPNDPIPN